MSGGVIRIHETTDDPFARVPRKTIELLATAGHLESLAVLVGLLIFSAFMSKFVIENRSAFIGLTVLVALFVVGSLKIDGFISVERFESLTTPGKIVSLSFWRDEEAVRAWRKLEAHRAAQARGRGGIFADYRLRVASVLRDYGMKEREQAPADSRDAHG